MRGAGPDGSVSCSMYTCITHAGIACRLSRPPAIATLAPNSNSAQDRHGGAPTTTTSTADTCGNGPTRGYFKYLSQKAHLMALVAQPRGERSQIRSASDEAMVRVPSERLKLGLEDACGRTVAQGCPNVRG